MSSSTDAVLRGADAVDVAPARLDADLRSSPLVRRHGADPRLVDPRLEEAFEELAERVRTAARAEGYAAGWAEGRRIALLEEQKRLGAERAARDEAARRHEAELSRALRGLADAARALEARAAHVAAGAEELALRAAAGLVETLLGRELATATEPGLDAVRRALDLAPRGRPVTVRLHPADAATLTSLQTDGGTYAVDGEATTVGAGAGTSYVVDRRSVTVVADAGLAPGDAVAECDATVVDARIAPALERVRAALLGESM